ncbi:hypothetical protein CEV32_4046 [Brucella rhizosphaerae]|uniref:Uncharacterized protein n=1 Tax=Brucella rhizosphaerae TaxID=571254 RepID=A0A256FR53_9HYPH|nr:hypothetical protein CEV32_4046 [Brucella rhizosphaerae]
MWAQQPEPMTVEAPSSSKNKTPGARGVAPLPRFIQPMLYGLRRTPSPPSSVRGEMVLSPARISFPL